MEVKLKPGAVDAYRQQEEAIVRAYAAAGVEVFWLCFQRPDEPTALLYLNLLTSPDGLEHAGARYQAAVKRNPHLRELSNRLADLVEAQSATLTSFVGGHAGDLAQSETLIVLKTRLPSGLASFPIAGGWLAYRAQDPSTAFLLRPARLGATSGAVAESPPSPFIPLAAAREYQLRPAMSRPGVNP